MSELYISTDIETDGPIPGSYSMLSIGAAAFTDDGKMIDTFAMNIVPLTDARQDPETMKWWATQPGAWAACQQDARQAGQVMTAYVEWVQKLPGSPVFVGYPAGFDWTFVYWYMMEFVGHSPFSFSALDIKSFAMAVLGTDYRQTVKRNMPKRWFGNTAHTHRAVDDAIGQGELFCSILAENRFRKSINGRPPSAP